MGKRFVHYVRALRQDLKNKGWGFQLSVKLFRAHAAWKYYYNTWVENRTVQLTPVRLQFKSLENGTQDIITKMCIPKYIYCELDSTKEERKIQVDLYTEVFVKILGCP